MLDLEHPTRGNKANESIYILPCDVKFINKGWRNLIHAPAVPRSQMWSRAGIPTLKTVSNPQKTITKSLMAYNQFSDYNLSVWLNQAGNSQRKGGFCKKMLWLLISRSAILTNSLFYFLNFLFSFCLNDDCSDHIRMLVTSKCWRAAFVLNLLNVLSQKTQDFIWRWYIKTCMDVYPVRNSID